MASRSVKGNIPPLNTQENVYDENTITDSDYDKNYVSELNSDQERSNENSLSTTPKSRATEKSANIATIVTGTSRKNNDHLDSELSKVKKNKSSLFEKIIGIEEEKLRAYKEKSKEKPKEDDSDFHFCMSLLPYMRNIPEKRKLAVRIKLQQILLEEQQCSQSVWTKSTEPVQQNYQEQYPTYLPTPSPQSSYATEDEAGSSSHAINLRDYLNNFQ